MGLIFKENEGCNYAYQYKIAMMWPKYKYTGGINQISHSSQLVLWEKYVW